MKSFSRFIFEVAQPSERGASEEQAFKDQHTYEVIPHPVALDHQHTGEIAKPELAADNAARRADQKGDVAYDQAYKRGNSEVFSAMEAVQTKLDDALSDKQKKIDHNNNGKIDGHDLAQLRKGKKKDLDELSPAKLGSYINKAHDDSSDFQNSAKRKKGIATATNKLVKKAGGKPEGSMFDESVDEGMMDNIKKKANDIRRKVVGPNQAEKDAAKKARQHASTMKNIGRAMSAVAKKDKAAEVARLKQGLKNVENQRKESVELDALEEDMNKVHTVDIDHTGGHDAAAKKHNITLKKSKDTADSHSATGKKKDLQKYLAHHYDSAEDAKDIHPEVHETTMSAMKRPVRQTGPDGKTRTVMKSVKVQHTDDHGQDKIRTNESIIAELQENMKFKPGNLRLQNGKSVNVSKQDSQLLNQMFKDLNPVNRRKLGAVAIKDPAGFEEIVGFAREAL